MSLFLAVDAGGTKTDYLLADGRQALARVRSATIKRMRADAASAETALGQALHDLEARTGLSLDQVERTCIGTAGERVPLVADWLRKEFAQRVGGELLLLGDVEIALDAAFPGSSGVLVLAGTGSNVAVRTARGAISTVGGWGPFLSDQGSGHRIGHEALRAAYLALDRGVPTTLMNKILHAFELETVDELIAFSNRQPSPDVSQLTSVVVRAAAEGDGVAAEVLRRQGLELGELACLALGRLAAGDGGEFLRLAFAGSIMEWVEPVRAALVEHVRAQFPSVSVLGGVVDPITGALWRARGGRTEKAGI